MKSHRFASLLWTVTILLLLAAPAGRAEDDDLPVPQNGMEEEVPFDPPAQEDALPDPSLGEEADALPAPSAGSEERAENQVNPAPETDDIFLPAPAGQESVNYAPYSPAGTPVSRANDINWRSAMESRPIFSLHGGMAMFNYPNKAVEGSRDGYTLGASVRLFDISQTVFLHVYGSMSWADVGNLGSSTGDLAFSNVKDKIVHLGGLLEVGIGRRLSLFGSILRRSHTLEAQRNDAVTTADLESFAPDLVSDGIKFGLGLQYDFYVIPHGSIGIRGHLEQDMALVALTMALEPAPPRKVSLNFKDEP